MEDVYCTLLLNDGYLPGAQVLAHSLRDGGTTKRLAVMVTLAGVNKDTVIELKKLYDYVIPVEPIYSRTSDGLRLMKRLDLSAALTKIHLWNQTQFRKVVYVDADMVAMRPPDELFDIDADFAASPDVGWPDCFNSGLMLAKPSKETYDKLLELAGQGASFDGADQGLLNQFFPDWHRLSFTYNCTIGSGMAYQYAPAFNHYGRNVSIVHFIGSQKPWHKGNIAGLSGSTDPYDRLTGYWWTVWNKHHRPLSHGGVGREYLDMVKGEGIGGEGGGPISDAEMNALLRKAPESQDSSSSQSPHKSASYEWAGLPTHLRTASVGTRGTRAAPPDQSPKFVPIRSINQPSRYHENFKSKDAAASPSAPVSPVIEEAIPPPAYDAAGTHHQQYVADGQVGDFVLTKEGPVEQEKYFQTGFDSYTVKQEWDDEQMSEPFFAPQQDWDPTKSAPPQHGAPEAAKLQVQKLENIWDKPASASTPFVARTFAPPPLHHLWYEIPQTVPEPREAPASKAIFPWETKPRQVSRVFMDSAPIVAAPVVVVEEKKAELPPPPGLASAARTEIEAPLKQVFPWEGRPRTVTRVFAGEESPQLRREDAIDDDLPRSVAGSDSDSWASFASRENKWDTDPAIRDYVLGLRRRKSRAPDDIAVIPGALDEISPVTPVPVRRAPPAWIADEGGDEETEPEWDAEKKLEELRRLPPLFVQEFAAGEMKSTDNPALEDKGMQTAARGEDEVAVRNDDADSVTPRISTMGLSARYKADTFKFKVGDVDLKATAGIPSDEGLHKRRVTRGHSVDSAIGSATDESESLRAESVEAA